MVKPEKEEERESFYWCPACKHTGRVALFRSQRGFWAVDVTHTEAFAAGEDVASEHAKFLGPDEPEGHRYPQAGTSHEDE